MMSEERELDGYRFKQTIGSGGFGKVKLAEHILTGELVAVKIVDKASVGEDLPRMYAELAAQKALSHQNICRLYQAVETEAKIYFVLEYCSGGELFDYIVRKEYLKEPEARHFFRQVVAALAYVHNAGYAHRDVKPENLLLTGDLQIKLIDFGLCAKPDGGLKKTQLMTACGSPAYAAPELITGQAYRGNEADIWSAGVLLYALLCGCLPFEDENVARLYQKIQTGLYDEPSSLSNAARSLIRGMLQTNPRHRLNIVQILEHPWLAEGYPTIKWKSIYDARLVDDECACEMARYYGLTPRQMAATICAWSYDEVTATYFLLLERKRRKRPVCLPPPPRRNLVPNSPLQVTSPTIHASLEDGLDDLEPLRAAPIQRLTLDSSDDEEEAMEERRPRKGSKPAQVLGPLPDSNNSYAQAIVAGARIVPTDKKAKDAFLRPPPPLPDTRPPSGTPAAIRRRREKENQAPTSATKYTTPRPLSASLYTTPNAKPGETVTTRRRVKRVDSRSLERHSAPMASPAAMAASPRGRSDKKESGGRRVFKSVERNIDRMRNLLTPSRGRGERIGEGPGGTTLLTDKAFQSMINVSTTGSTDPAAVMAVLEKACIDQDIAYERSGWTLSVRKAGVRKLAMELEVLWIARVCLVGVRRKRLAGDALLYKRLCERVLTAVDE